MKRDFVFNLDTLMLHIILVVVQLISVTIFLNSFRSLGQWDFKKEKNRTLLNQTLVKYSCIETFNDNSSKERNQQQS